MNETAQKALEAGGKNWNDKRVYFNSPDVVAKFLGWEVTFYGTGSISSAKDENGERVSNNKATKALMAIQYVDCATGEVV